MEATYKKVKYPDGQISVKLIETPLNSVLIKERINSYEDLFCIKSIVEALRHENSKRRIGIFIPMLFGQRSDRRFSENQSFDLKIICDFINSCNFDRVEVFDPHSEVSIALLNNSVKIEADNYVQRVLSDLPYGSNTTLVSPDGGSYKKLFRLGEKFNSPVVAANKYRDKDGKISLTFVGEVKDKECLIVDDLGDGCRTFVELAKQLKAQGASKVYLYISHAYFSAGLSELRKYIDHIYCTNSVKDLPDEWFNGQGTVPVSDFVTQYKVI